MKKSMKVKHEQILVIEPYLRLNNIIAVNKVQNDYNNNNSFFEENQ